ncbi:cytochrome c [Blastomonas sp.]|uniref:cytochrome c n=1 Tax=Blastomonas sp. TaxID=1909299 RepID=UPI003593602E
MNRWPAILALLVMGCDSKTQVVFADAAITLPDDPMTLPPGPGMQAVLDNCTACHSPSTMLQQPKVSREKWQSIVVKMIEVYKAPVDEQAIPAIVDYLVAAQTVEAQATDRSATAQ